MNFSPSVLELKEPSNSGRAVAFKTLSKFTFCGLPKTNLGGSVVIKYGEGKEKFLGLPSLAGAACWEGRKIKRQEESKVTLLSSPWLVVIMRSSVTQPLQSRQEMVNFPAPGLLFFVVREMGYDWSDASVALLLTFLEKSTLWDDATTDSIHCVNGVY